MSESLVMVDASAFAKSLQKYAMLKKKSIHEVVVKAALQAFKRISLATPVDTGTLRAGWRIEFPAEATAVIYNEVEYVTIIEFVPGYSKKAPNGMVRITMRSMEKYIERLIKESMKRGGYGSGN